MKNLRKETIKKTTLLTTLFILLFITACGGGEGEEDTAFTAGILPGLVMVRFPTGTFMMGSPEDETGRQINEGQVAVTLNQAFEIGKHEVTQQQWFSIMDTNPSYFREERDCPEDYTEWTNTEGEKVGMCPKHPVETVSWSDTQEFFRRLNQVDGVAGCEENPREKGCWRLPTEAEWEYAARAGKATRYSFGDDEDMLDDYGWYKDNANEQTHRVGTKKVNPKGLHDMHGNVWEWVMDVYANNLLGGDNPLQTVGDRHVIRGGSWKNEGQNLRTAFRFPSQGKDSISGFRIVRTEGH